jgi:hypothetical protein
MLNTDPTDRATDEAVAPVLRAGSRGAMVLAGLATGVVVAIWFAFYFLVFVPRASGP